MSAGNDQVIVEELDQRLKVTLPTGVNWPAFALHSLAILIWLGMLVAVLVYLFRGLSSSFVLTAILLLWLLIWLWFGRFLWRRWQYHASNREVLFVDPEQFIIRRPVSILGLTWAYDMNHISGLYYSDLHNCPAFDYAYHHVYFGRMLEKESVEYLIGELNRRYFPEESVAEVVLQEQ